MPKLSRNQTEREKMKVTVNKNKQYKLDDVSFQFNIQKIDGSKPEKTILITHISNLIKEDELELKVEFTLSPSKESFSKVFLDLFFENQKLSSTPLLISQSTLFSDNLMYKQIVDMSGVEAGSYLFRVEMYELWDNSEKLNFVTKQITLEYVPKRRQDRLVKVPTVKTFPGDALVVDSSETKSIYQKIEQENREESASKRDSW